MLKDPLFLTITLEILALIALREKDVLLYVYWMAITTLTNIPANMYVAYVFSGGAVAYWITIAVIEALVFVSEYLMCLAYTKDNRKSLKYSAICNLTSYCIGSLILILL